MLNDGFFRDVGRSEAKKALRHTSNVPHIWCAHAQLTSVHMMHASDAIHHTHTHIPIHVFGIAFTDMVPLRTSKHLPQPTPLPKKKRGIIR